ncbi:hypothetical protein SCAR479_08631 [Seiridium cardinale]|uniref:Uncharacterized protein n=1 Tax=Seiridium cardinale TaxID=138064 RepID=A0ABR2XLY1_9PEZI
MGHDILPSHADDRWDNNNHGAGSGDTTCGKTDIEPQEVGLPGFVGSRDDEMRLPNPTSDKTAHNGNVIQMAART